MERVKVNHKHNNNNNKLLHIYNCGESKSKSLEKKLIEIAIKPTR